MKHIDCFSRQATPAASPLLALSLLEKEAFTELFQQNITQVTVIVNLVQDLKSGGEEEA